MIWLFTPLYSINHNVYCSLLLRLAHPLKTPVVFHHMFHRGTLSIFVLCCVHEKFRSFHGSIVMRCCREFKFFSFFFCYKERKKWVVMYSLISVCVEFDWERNRSALSLYISFSCYISKFHFKVNFCWFLRCVIEILN